MGGDYFVWTGIENRFAQNTIWNIRDQAPRVAPTGDTLGGVKNLQRGEMERNQ